LTYIGDTIDNIYSVDGTAGPAAVHYKPLNIQQSLPWEIRSELYIWRDLCGTGLRRIDRGVRYHQATSEHR
jgi:hypothetical protein